MFYNEFNEYFTTIGAKLADNLPVSNVSPAQYLKGNYPVFNSFTTTTPEEINTIIKNLKLVQAMTRFTVKYSNAVQVP